ncbi:hypothetical protein [Nocardioides sp. HB32]
MRTVAALALTAGLLVGLPQSAQAQESCNGDPATIVGTPGAAIVGTTDRDVVVTNGAASVDTLAGIDVVCVTGGVPTTMEGGPGRDRAVVAVPGGFVRMDLGAGTLSSGPGGDGSLTGFEDATVRAHGALVDGTSGPNDIRWNLCTGTITAQRGPDKVTWAGGEDLCVAGDQRTWGAFGGGGQDLLIGSPWADTLVGGRGHDVGDGRGGFDRCRVEVARNCESDR